VGDAREGLRQEGDREGDAGTERERQWAQWREREGGTGKAGERRVVCTRPTLHCPRTCTRTRKRTRPRRAPPSLPPPLPHPPPLLLPSGTEYAERERRSGGRERGRQVGREREEERWRDGEVGGTEGRKTIEREGGRGSESGERECARVRRSERGTARGWESPRRATTRSVPAIRPSGSQSAGCPHRLPEVRDR
jgi:hypothetical protein